MNPNLLLFSATIVLIALIALVTVSRSQRVHQRPQSGVETGNFLITTHVLGKTSDGILMGVQTRSWVRVPPDDAHRITATKHWGQFSREEVQEALSNILLSRVNAALLSLNEEQSASKIPLEDKIKLMATTVLDVTGLELSIQVTKAEREVQ